MKFKTIAKAISAIFTIFILSAATVLAQADQGRIAGTITDANGAVVPGATIKITNEATGEVRTTTAGDDGTFLVTALKPAKYSVTVSAANFEAITKRNLDLLVGQRLEVSIPLGAQAVSAEVDIVSGEAPGNCADTEMVGKSTVGRAATGRKR